MQHNEKKKQFWDLIIKFHEKSNKKNKIWNEIKNSHIFHSINDDGGKGKKGKPREPKTEVMC